MKFNLKSTKKQIFKLLIEIPLLICLILIIFFLGFYAGKARGTRIESRNSDLSNQIHLERERDYAHALLLTYSNYQLEKEIIAKTLEIMTNCNLLAAACINKGVLEGRELKARQDSNNAKISELYKRLGLREN